MSKVEGGGGPIDPPSRLRVTIFSRRLLRLTMEGIRGVNLTPPRFIRCSSFVP